MTANFRFTKSCQILAFSQIFVPLKSYLSGNTIWPQASNFKNSPKLTIFGIFNELLSTQNVNVARFALVEWDFFCNFKHCVLTCGQIFSQNLSPVRPRSDIGRAPLQSVVVFRASKYVAYWGQLLSAKNPVQKSLHNSVQKSQKITFRFLIISFHHSQCLKITQNVEFAIFQFWHFLPILSGNTVWPQTLGFHKLAKIDYFWHF